MLTMKNLTATLSDHRPAAVTGRGPTEYRHFPRAATTETASGEMPGPDAPRASLPGSVSAARQALGAELRRRREIAGWRQGELARKMTCSRTWVSQVEHGRLLGSRQLWESADGALGADGALVRHRDQVTALAAAVADDAVRDRQRAPGGRGLAAPVPGGSDDPISVVRSCPHCSALILLTVEMRAIRIPEQYGPGMMPLTTSMAAFASTT
jgi:hypothetical protein